MLRYVLLFVFIAGIAPVGFAYNSAAADGFVDVQNVSRPVDEEYERYKKRGDEYYAEGEYQNALRQYRNCLEVPNFENDPYAKGRIELCQKLIKLREQANQSLKQGNGEEAVGTFEQMLLENPKDSITKVNLTDYWTGEATELYKQQNYEEAIERYKKALKYATRSGLIQLQIQNSEAFIKYRSEQAVKVGIPEKKEMPQEEMKEETLDPITITSAKPGPAEFTKPKRRIGAKILTAAIGLGAGGYAYSLNNGYQTKLDELNRIGKTADPDGDNVILTPGEFNPWQSAYQAAKEAKNDRSKFMASLGVAGAAAITEIILFALPKSKKTTGLSLGAATQRSGLAVRYIFK